MASHHSESKKSVSKDHHSSQSLVVSRRRQEQDVLKPEAERVIPHDPEVFLINERNAQEQEIFLSRPGRISSPIIRIEIPLKMNIVLLHLRATSTEISCGFKFPNFQKKWKIV
ncbi:hypothetical protein O181_005863 [Austropuccinia psidii MF-1]|uniref:Uncharacterized protein n=1 Tax=Austropuccinia psidii MF-1 TaxID=1389203 RepID=A0A9Q3GFZ7_9BASI|nr:hypothetical protein [Austropuccinia psidii MF-1]